MMDEFGFTNSPSTPETNWNLLPKARVVLQQSLPIDRLTQTTSEFTDNMDMTFEERQSRPPTPYLPDLDDSSSSPEGWSKRQLSCPPKTPGPPVDDSPAKSEEMPEEKSPPKDGRSSPEANCSICLEKVVNRSFTNGCLHTFCFGCLLQWSKIKAECPLCKQAFKSIIHNVQENHKYDEYHIVPPLPSLPPPEFREFREFITALEVTLPRFGDPRREGQPFRYSTTVTSNRERIVYSTAAINTGQWVIPSTSLSDRYRSRFWFHNPHRSNRRNDLRKNVYARDLWALGPIDITGRYRECSPEFFRENPAQVHRLVPWLNRELDALMNSSVTSVLIDMILRSITRFDIQSREFYRLLSPHLNMRTNHFIHEFYTFARSTFDMVGYDQAVTYGSNPNRMAHVVLSDDSDSDVLVLPSDTAGPSGVSSRPAAASSSAAAATEDDSDDCQVVECIKPRHERTPEVIDLLSEDEQPAADIPDIDTRIVLEDSDSPKSASNSVHSEYVPNQQKKLKRKKAHKEDDPAPTKRKTSKKSKHTVPSKSAVKKGKGKKRKSSSPTEHGVNSDEDDDLKPLVKRGRPVSRRKIYSSDEAGPSSSYRNHLRSSSRPHDTLPEHRSSYYVVPPLRMNALPLSSRFNPYLSCSSSEGESAAKSASFSDAYRSSPAEMNVSSIASSTFNFSPESGHSCSSRRQDKPDVPLTFACCATSSKPVPCPSTSKAPGVSQEAHLQSEEILDDHRVHLTACRHNRRPSPRNSPPSSATDLAVVNSPGPSDASRKDLKHKRSCRLWDVYADKYRKRKSKCKRESRRKSKSPSRSPTPEALASNSWIIKPEEVPVPESVFLPDVDNHTTSPSTDSSNSRPRLKSIIITRQNHSQNSSTFSPVASSSYSSYPRRKHKYRRISGERSSSTDSDEW